MCFCYQNEFLILVPLLGSSHQSEELAEYGCEGYDDMRPCDALLASGADQGGYANGYEDPIIDMDPIFVPLLGQLLLI